MINGAARKVINNLLGAVTVGHPGGVAQINIIVLR